MRLTVPPSLSQPPTRHRFEGASSRFPSFRTRLEATPESRALEHGEWLGLLVEREATLRQQKRFEARARAAKLRHAATVEDVDFRAPRGVDRTMFLRLANCDWIREHRHCLITGKTGTGKFWLACALGDKACRENLSVLYQRCTRLFAALALARGDGRYAMLMRTGGGALDRFRNYDILAATAGFAGVAAIPVGIRRAA